MLLVGNMDRVDLLLLLFGVSVVGPYVLSAV